MDVQILCNAILFMQCLLVLNEVITNFIKHPSIRRYLNNTIITTLIGIAAGLFLKFINSPLVIQEYRRGFSQFFLIVLLPPILFESAINMEKALFFQNFGSILMFAIFGTIIATFLTGTGLFLIGLLGDMITLSFPLELTSCFAFGALISSTDPVAVLSIFKSLGADKNIYILLYGESILNDAISIVLYDISVRVQKGGLVGFWAAIGQFSLIFIVSIIIGVAVGVLCAYILKIKEQVHYETEHIEVSVTVIIPWVCYLLSQALGFSGIVSLVFCGIFMAKYALPNLSESGKELLNKFYHILSYNFENLVFLFIGIGIMGYNIKWKEMGIFLAIATIILIIFARFANIKVVSYILNRYRHENYIKDNHQKAMWYCGLRGAMAYALALDSTEAFPKDGEILLTLTIVMICFNIFGQGILLNTVLEKCDLQEKIQDIENEDRILHTSKGIINRFKDVLEQCDEQFLQKYLIKQTQQSPIRNEEKK